MRIPLRSLRLSGETTAEGGQRIAAGVTAQDLACLVYSPAEIEQRGRAIYCRSLAESENLCPGNYDTLGGSDLLFLFALYDEYFLNNLFRGMCRGCVSFRVSTRMTRSAGMVRYRDRSGPFTVSLSRPLLLGAFTVPGDSVMVNGLECHDRLEVTMRVLEHEIVHLLELIAFGSTSCARGRFRRLSRALFGHTDVTHGLASPMPLLRRRSTVRPGDTVRFRYRGLLRWGTVSRVTKRATVIVREAGTAQLNGTGARYAKYYVPLHCLE